MPKYTTGELAKLCGVTVRTGRRLYSGEDLQRLKTICFLRDIGLSIDGIASLLKEENAGDVIQILLGQHAALLKAEIAGRRRKLPAPKGMQALERLLRENLKRHSVFYEKPKKASQAPSYHTFGRDPNGHRRAGLIAFRDFKGQLAAVCRLRAAGDPLRRAAHTDVLSINGIYLLAMPRRFSRAA